MASADRHGIDALSMRKLAKQLGYEVMSLYNHVANKEEVLDGIVDLAASEIELPGQGDWQVELRRTVHSARQVLQRHPWLAGLWWVRRAGPARTAYMEALLRTFREAAFPAEIAFHGYHAVLMHILGFTVQELDLRRDQRPLAARADEFLRAVGSDHPYLLEHVRQHIDGVAGPDGFDYVLDLILDGLERARAAAG